MSTSICVTCREREVHLPGNECLVCQLDDAKRENKRMFLKQVDAHDLAEKYRVQSDQLRQQLAETKDKLLGAETMRDVATARLRAVGDSLLHSGVKFESTHDEAALVTQALAEAKAEVDRLSADNAEMHVSHEVMTLEVDAAWATSKKLAEALARALRCGVFATTSNAACEAYVMGQAALADYSKERT